MRSSPWPVMAVRKPRARAADGRSGKLEMMSLGRAMLRFFFLAAIGHQLTYTFVEGGIFEPTRRRLSTVHPSVDEFVHCHRCVQTWVGIVLAAVYRPHLLADVDGRPPSAARNAANVAGDAVLIALGTGLWTDVLGLLRREVRIKQVEIEPADESAPLEIDRAVLPGISIRS